MLSNGLAIKHGIEGRNFVDSHGRHGKKLCDVIHNADTCPSLVLSLCKVEQRNDGRLLVLVRVIRNDLTGPCKVFGSELEGDFWVVICGVPVDEYGVGGSE